MVYDSSELSLKYLLQPVIAAEDALARLDDRVGRKNDLGQTNGHRSRDGLLRENEGWIERSHFMEACNALWLAGSLFMSKIWFFMMHAWTSAPRRMS